MLLLDALQLYHRKPCYCKQALLKPISTLLFLRSGITALERLRVQKVKWWEGIDEFAKDVPHSTLRRLVRRTFSHFSYDSIPE